MRVGAAACYPGCEIEAGNDEAAGGSEESGCLDGVVGGGCAQGLLFEHHGDVVGEDGGELRVVGEPVDELKWHEDDAAGRLRASCQRGWSTSWKRKWIRVGSATGSLR